MAKAKPIRKKKSSAKKKSVPAKTAKKKTAKRVRPVASVKSQQVKKAAAHRKPFRGRRLSSAETPFTVGSAVPRRGLGAESGGQSGATQGLSRMEDVDSESVEELASEGQDYEAEVVSGVENARDPDQGEVRTKEVPEDDVPEEYLDAKDQ